jgi:hypothetical protein
MVAGSASIGGSAHYDTAGRLDEASAGHGTSGSERIAE